MAQHHQLPFITTTRLEVSPGQEVGMHDFLRGLRRPRPRVIAVPAPHDILSLNATAAVDRSVSFQSEGPSRGLSKEQDELLTPPMRLEIHAMVHRPMNNIMEAPNVNRFYTRKAKFLSPATEEPRGPLPLSCSRGALQDVEQLTEDRQHESEVKMDSPDIASKRQTPLTKANSEIYLSDFPKKQRHDETLISDPEIIRQKKRKIRANEKKRRVPVNELALVPSLPTRLNLSPAAEHNRPVMIISGAGCEGQPEEALDDIDLTLLGEIGDPRDQGSYNNSQAQVSRKATIAKPQTEIRRIYHTPKRHSISHASFRFPPADPNAAKTREWKLGSGFEGTELTSTAGLKSTKVYQPKVQGVKQNRFRATSIRGLELSTTKSPSVQAKTCQWLPHGSLLLCAKTVSERSSPSRKLRSAMKTNELKTDQRYTDSGGEAICDLYRAVATPMIAPTREADLRKSVRLSAAQTPYTRLNRIVNKDKRESEDSQNIGEPPNSQRVGLLNHRKKVSFVFQASGESERHSPQEACTDSAENDFDTHNTTWYGEARAESQQTLPLTFPSRYAIKAEQITERSRSYHCRPVISAESKDRLGMNTDRYLTS